MLSTLKEELNWLMSSVGLPVEWRMITHHPPNEEFLEIAIVRFQGTCRAVEEAVAMANSPACALPSAFELL